MTRYIFNSKRLFYGLCAVAGVCLIARSTEPEKFIYADSDLKSISYPTLPKRKELLKKLETTEVFDIFVIGGGATGAGVALDGSVKGLKVALVERNDYASGTSSKSTKLIHGGVRYLQNAVFKLDIGEFNLVNEALRERKIMVDSAPYLTSSLPIMIPLYTYWEIPYYWFGLKLYDLISGFHILRSSYFLSKEKTLDTFPLLKRDNLRGSIVYYDGQQDDARMNIAIILTSISKGAVALNYVEFVSVEKDADGEYSVVTCKDKITGKLIHCKARVIVNASGPFTDSVRQKKDNESMQICKGASGTHLILPKYFSPDKMGLLDANTADGRVLFLIPWENYTLAGTTDTKCQIVDAPVSTQADIDFIIKELNIQLNDDVKVKHEDIKSAWSGIRPLVVDPNVTTKETADISRSHVIEVKDNFITIAGGKWTIYRAMAEDTVNKALEVLDKNKSFSKNRTHLNTTKDTKMWGSQEWTPIFYAKLISDFHLDEDVATYLSSAYGTAALQILQLAENNGKYCLHKIHENFPYTKEEIIYCCRNEYVCSATDIIGRRLRFAFLDSKSAFESLPLVIDIISKELMWSKERIESERKLAEDFIRGEMGLDLIEKQKK